jgi:hypothetical protein
MPQCRASHGRASESRSGIWQVANTNTSRKVNGFIGALLALVGPRVGHDVAARKASIVCICCPGACGGEWKMFRVARPKEGRGPHVVSWVAANLQGKTRGARTTNCRKGPHFRFGAEDVCGVLMKDASCSIRRENLRPGSFVPAALCRDLLRLQPCVMKEGPRCWCGGQVLAFKSGGCGCRGVVDAAHPCWERGGCGVRSGVAGFVAPRPGPRRGS